MREEHAGPPRAHRRAAGPRRDRAESASLRRSKAPAAIRGSYRDPSKAPTLHLAPPWSAPHGSLVPFRPSEPLVLPSAPLRVQGMSPSEAPGPWTQRGCIR